MNKQAILYRLQQIVRDITDDDEAVLMLDTVADDVDGWDSINHIKIILDIESEFDLRFDVEEVATISDVGSLVDLIASKL